MKIDFFKQEDFYTRTFIQKYAGSPITGKLITVEDAMLFANEKLESKGKIVYSIKDAAHESGFRPWVDNDFEMDQHTHEALLIDIKEINKCEHPKEMVESFYKEACRKETKYFKCECGTIVQPSGFKEV